MNKIYHDNQRYRMHAVHEYASRWWDTLTNQLLSKWLVFTLGLSILVTMIINDKS